MSEPKPLTNEELEKSRAEFGAYSGITHTNRGKANCLAGWVMNNGPRLFATIEALKAKNKRRPARPTIVCLCGSSRFVPEMAVIAWALERDEGKITLGLHLLPDNYPGVQADHQAEAEGVAEKMDALHLRKIDLADQVLVVNIGGYIGESTAREVAYAREQGKDVRFLVEEEEDGNAKA